MFVVHARVCSSICAMRAAAASCDERREAGGHGAHVQGEALSEARSGSRSQVRVSRRVRGDGVTESCVSRLSVSCVRALE